MELSKIKKIRDHAMNMLLANLMEGDMEGTADYFEAIIVTNSFPYGKFKGLNMEKIPETSLHWYIQQDWFFPNNRWVHHFINQHLVEINYLVEVVPGVPKEDVE